MQLKNRVAVVTGSGRGIGEAIARRFVKEGAKVVICDLNETDVNRTVRELTGEGGTVLGFVANVANSTEINNMMEKVLQEFGTIDILINNAGITRDGLAHKLSEEAWDLVINVNLKGTFNCCKAVIPTLVKNKYGKIINISSAAWNGNVGQSNYAASKAGVIGLMRTLAKEYASKGLNVNTIAPGPITTEMYMQVPEKVRELINKSNPMGRAGSVEEIASACLFLASDESSYINGQVLNVDGGMYMS